MASWPANGDTDWNTKSLAYLAVEHNSDGTHNIHDAEGGYAQVNVNGTKTKVYTKYLTGTTDNDSETAVAHGVTTGLTKILSVTASIYTAAGSAYTCYGAYLTAAVAEAFLLRYDGTNILLGTVGTSLRSQTYKIKIDYIL